MTVKEFKEIGLKENTIKVANIIASITTNAQDVQRVRHFTTETFSMNVLDLTSYIDAMSSLSQIRELLADNGYYFLAASTLSARVDEALNDIDSQITELDTFANEKGII